MNYNAFKTQWTAALAHASLLYPFDRPAESVDLDHMERKYAVLLGLAGQWSAEPFAVTCELAWRWRALQAARTSTTEEDLLTEVHGRDEAAEMDTQRPWLRVDVTLRATLPWEQPRKMPGRPTWRRFVAAVAKEVAPLFPAHQIEFNDGPAVLGWCGAPTAEAFLERTPETRERFHRVAELIGGFETSYGLELLSSVHWVATREDQTARTDTEAAVRAVHAWTDWKRQNFRPRHIEVAWSQLRDHGWLQ